MTTFTKWSNETYGDTVKKLVISEDIFKIKEKLFEDVSNVKIGKCYK